MSNPPLKTTHFNNASCLYPPALLAIQPPTKRRPYQTGLFASLHKYMMTPPVHTPSDQYPKRTQTSVPMTRQQLNTLNPNSSLLDSLCRGK